MSAQFGRWNFDGKPIERGYLDRVSSLCAPYGLDGKGSHTEDGLAIVHHAFHATKESRREVQPHLSLSGAVITWDGILDNRAELIQELKPIATTESTDVEIVAAAYDQWRNNCFVRLKGDWALVIWNRARRSLLLGKDFLGARHLYYLVDQHRITWSTIIDPLVLLAGKSFALDEEYIAGWLSSFPASHLTPYREVSSVPPASVVEVRPTDIKGKKYWDFDPTRRIRYRSDADYEEHFLAEFRKCVRRKLRSDSPVLAELSGGMDSSSIVCMADRIMAEQEVETPRLDTVSYFDDSEPNWNERPYASKVEEKRKRTGWHIEVNSHKSLTPSYEDLQFTPLPGSRGPFTRSAQQFTQCLVSNGNRILLSGIGGDEVTGGVPAPVPELADLLARARIKTLAQQTTTWALHQRRSWFGLLFETLNSFLPPRIAGVADEKRPAAWLEPEFVKKHQAACRGYETRRKLSRSLPSFQENLSTLEALRGQLACSTLSSEAVCQRRYPYLDRDLLEFLYAVPCRQLLRPGQRRSLMRRSLLGIVPEEILQRRRKAFVIRSPMLAFSEDRLLLSPLTEDMVTAALSIVNAKICNETLARATHGFEIPLVPLMRTMQIEAWLRHACAWNVLSAPGLDKWNSLFCPNEATKFTRELTI